MSDQFPGNAGFYGGAGPNTTSSEYAALDFVIRQIMGGSATASPVRVLAVTNNGGVSPVGTVDAQPMVHQVDGLGNVTPHGIIHSLPYFRLQGGTNAIIIDPKVGDNGLAVFASHDTSSVRSNKAPSPPGSRRRFDWADGFYLGGFLNGTPTQYVQFTDTGVVIVDKNGNTINMKAGGVDITATLLTLNGNMQVNGNIHATGTITP